MKKFLLVFCFIMILAGLTAIGYYLWYNLPMHKIERALEDEDYEKVVELFAELSKEEDEKQVRKVLFDVAEDKFEAYVEETIEYEELTAYFKLVNKKIFRKDEEFQEMYDKSERIHEDRGLYADGIEQMDAGSYIEAMKIFEQVSRADLICYKKARDKAKECRESFVELIFGKADEFVEKKDYDSAIEILEQGYEKLPTETIFQDKISEIAMAREVRLQTRLLLTYDMGDILAKELGIEEYTVYFPVTFVLEVNYDQMALYIDKDSIKPAIEALTADPDSMEAIYKVAEAYGIKKREADLLIKLTYKGSYADFIAENFSTEIDTAMKDFSFQSSCVLDQEKIYLGKEKNETEYFHYEDGNESFTLKSYHGNNQMLSTLKYPLQFVEN